MLLSNLILITLVSAFGRFRQTESRHLSSRRHRLSEALGNGLPRPPAETGEKGGSCYFWRERPLRQSSGGAPLHKIPPSPQFSSPAVDLAKPLLNKRQPPLLLLSFVRWISCCSQEEVAAVRVEENMIVSEQERLDLGFNYTITSRIRFSSDCSPDSRGTITEYEWTDYCPEVFRKLQNFEQIDADDYLQSIRSCETIKLLFLRKKNAPRLLSSYDDRFIFKTLSKAEMKVILEMLPNYYHHVQKYRDTLLTKLFGLHVVKPSNGQKVRFIIMANILQSDVSIHKTFNLKGSSQNRSISKTGADEELHFAFHLHTPIRNHLLAQIKHDCKFLEDEGIMDYTLLLGMHVCPAPFDSVIKDRNPSANAAGSDDGKSSPSVSPKLSLSDADIDSVSVTDSESSCQTEPDVKFGVKMPARVVDTRRRERWSGAPLRTAGKQENNKVFLYFGIVDIIQGYGMLKRVENAFKNLHADPQSTSAVNPKAYSARFQELVLSVFPEKKY